MSSAPMRHLGPVNRFVNATLAVGSLNTRSVSSTGATSAVDTRPASPTSSTGMPRSISAARHSISSLLRLAKMATDDQTGSEKPAAQSSRSSASHSSSAVRLSATCMVTEPRCSLLAHRSGSTCGSSRSFGSSSRRDVAWSSHPCPVSANVVGVPFAFSGWEEAPLPRSGRDSSLATHTSAGLLRRLVVKEYKGTDVVENASANPASVFAAAPRQP